MPVINRAWLRAATALPVVSLALLSTHPVSAAEPAAPVDAPDAGSGLGDIVVTATRKETRLQSTPVAVSVIDETFRSNQNVLTARDLAGQIPGLYTPTTGITPLTNTFFIRGIGNSDPIFDPTVGVYIDDVYLPRAINGMSDLTDIERVEVLRGPQGTLFGANSAGGAIRYVTRTPGDTLDLRLDAGYGNYQTFNAHAYVAGPLVPGLLAASIAFAHDEHEGYTWNPSLRRRVNNQNTDGGRIKLVFTPSSTLKVTLSADGTVDHSQAAQYVATTYNATNPALSGLGAITGGTLFSPTQFSTFRNNVSYAGRYGINRSHSGGITGRVDYDLNPHLSIHSISALRGFDQDPVNYNNDGQNRLPYNSAQPRRIDISDNYIVYKQKSFTQELQLQGDWNRFDFTGGLYYLFENFRSNRIGYVTGLPASDTALPAAPFDQIGKTITRNYSAYLQANYRLTDRLTLTAGGRYISIRRAFDFQGVNYDLDGNPIDPTLYPQVRTGGAIPTLGVNVAASQVNFTNAGVLNRKTWHAFTPKAGLSYQVTPAIFLFANYSRGFDAGGFNNRALNVATALPYAPETVDTFEGGFKSDWFDSRLRINLTGFYNDYKNLQTSVSAFSPISGTYVSTRGNAPSAHTQGFELETSAQPVDNLSLAFNVTYLKTRFDDYSAPALGTIPAYNYTGKAFSGQPEWQYFASADYGIPISGVGTIKLGGSVNWQTSYFSDLLNSPQYRIGDKHFVNGFVGFTTADGRWDFTLTARNIGNAFYFSTLTPVGTPLRAGPFAGTQLVQGAQNAPRTVFFKVAYKY
ncbi:TonB-dependent receptor [Sphingobium amiense]|uniref:TonB-dependent receptor n=1 Tax=Sphingobium amiense TaxID=135719 RepID=A0A494W9F9_9SPHN|nr:TonB-dependent receptor [Sphingobium amiense]BBD99966.1 TonB-dependent receptor [Sphingobium amiense]